MMNFCGGGVDQQVVQEEYISGNLLPEGAMCGACVKVDSEDQFDQVDSSTSLDPPATTATLLETPKIEKVEPKEEKRFESPTPKKVLTSVAIRTATKALNSIEEAFDGVGSVTPPDFKPKHISVVVTDPVFDEQKSGDLLDYTTPSQLRDRFSVTPPSSSRRHTHSIHTSSPSPILLNPLSQSDLSGKTNLLCPTLDRHDKGAAIESLIQRLEQGFKVRLIKGPGSRTLKGHELRLFLHRDRTRLMLQCSSETDEKKDDSIDLRIYIHLHTILRLEVNGGRNRKQRRSFTLYVKKELQEPKAYEFEALSTLEREVIVSSMMIILDQAYFHQLPMRPSSFSDSVETGDYLSEQQGFLDEFHRRGTMDEPILCSPSLEEETSFFKNDSRETENHELSPKRRTQIYDDEKGTETALVIHLENRPSIVSDFSHDGQQSKDKPGILYRRSQESSEVQSSVELDGVHATQAEAQMLEERNPQLVKSRSGSHFVAGNWCTDDVCTLALRDIADTCTGMFALKHQGDSSCLTANFACSDQLVVLEDYITTALGAPTAVYSYFMEGDIWHAEPSFTPQGEERISSRRIQNRANLLNAQATRLRNLRNEMTFAAALRQSQEKMHYVQTTQSFDDAHHFSSTRRQIKAASEAAARLHTSPLLKHVVNTMMLSDSDNRCAMPENVVYYDSDPEDVKPRNIRDRGPRKVAASYVKEERSIDRDRRNMSTSSMKTSQGLSKIPIDKKVRKLDEDSVIDIVQTMLNERMLLMWHPTQTASHPNQPPICVKAWIESGVYLIDGTFLLPKLTWIKATEDQRTERARKYQQQTKALQKFDLLDVCRIFPTETIDRKRYPFPSASRSFIIETGNNTFLMEAQNIEERDRIVYGLKLVIARLASLLMLRDVRAADEFFGAMTCMVPGEAPRWTQGSSGESEIRQHMPSTV